MISDCTRALQKVGNHGAIASISVKGSNTDWIKMDNTWGAAFEISISPSAPLSFKFEQDDGQTVVATDVVTSNGATGKFDTGVQFTDAGGGSSRALVKQVGVL